MENSFIQPLDDAELVVKGALANSRCIEIMALIAKDNMGYSEGDLAYSTKLERSQVAEYVALLMRAKLLNKESDSNTGVVCYLTDAGKQLLHDRAQK